MYLKIRMNSEIDKLMVVRLVFSFKSLQNIFQMQESAIYLPKKKPIGLPSTYKF